MAGCSDGSFHCGAERDAPLPDDAAGAPLSVRAVLASGRVCSPATFAPLSRTASITLLVVLTLCWLANPYQTCYSDTNGSTIGSLLFPGKHSVPTAEEFRRRFDEVQRELVRMGQVRQLVPAAQRNDQLLVLLESPVLLSVQTNQGTGTKLGRGFAVRMLLLNQTTSNVTVPGEGIWLEADNQRVAQLGGQKETGFVRLPSGRAVSLSQINPVEQLTVPVGGVCDVWLVFGPFESNRPVPRMAITLEHKGGRKQVDVNRFFLAALKVRVHRLGPRGCLAVLRIGGRLNVVNVRELEGILGQLEQSGVRRAVIACTESAPPASTEALQLLAAQVVEPEHEVVWGVVRGRFNQFGGPLDIDVPIYLAGLKQQKASRSPSLPVHHAATLAGACWQQRKLFAQLAHAVVAALWDIYQRLPRTELLRRLQEGLAASGRTESIDARAGTQNDTQAVDGDWDALELAAALMAGADSLPAAAESLVLRASRHPAGIVRQAAAFALRRFPSKTAVYRLVDLATTDADARLDAVEGLASHCSDLGRQQLSELLRQGRLTPTVQLVRLLAAHPDPRWADVLVSWVQQTEDEQLAAESLKTLQLIGHPQLEEILRDALTDRRPKLGHVAFQLLSEQNDPRWQGLLVQFALRRLKKGAVTPQMLTLLTEARDMRAVPLLKAFVERGEGDVKQAIHALGGLGGSSTADWLNDLYSRVKDPAVKTVILSVLRQLHSEHFWTRAAEALRSDDPALFGQTVYELEREGSSQSIALLENALLESHNRRLFAAACESLARLATPGAREALRRALLKHKDDEDLQSVVADAFATACARSSAANLVRQAEVFAQKRDWQNALYCYELAEQIDADLPDVLRGMAHCELMLDRVEQAYGHFKEALELLPVDGVALSGMAVAAVRLGRIDEGLRTLRLQYDRFKNDSLFQYNAACVYARAVEQLASRKDPKTRERKTRLEQKAIECLRRAFELGFDDRAWVEIDPDLKPLHDNPEFQRLLKGGGGGS